MFAMTIALSGDMRYWDGLKARECQAVVMSCLQGTWEKNDGYERNIAVYFRIEEHSSTPHIGDLGMTSAHIAYVPKFGGQQMMKLKEAEEGRLKFTSAAGLPNWLIYSIDASDVQHLLPEMMYRAMRVRIIANTTSRGHLWASLDGSLLKVVSENLTGRGTEWLFSAAPSGDCCRLEAADVRTSRRFLGPAGDGSVAELWPESDAFIWNSEMLPPRWLHYIRTPAPVGMYSKRINVGSRCDRNTGDCARIPSMAEVQSTLGIRDNSLFGSDLRCYSGAMPTGRGRASITFPDKLPMVQFHQHRFGSLFLIWSLLEAGLLVGFLTQWIMYAVLVLCRFGGHTVTVACLMLSYVFHAITLISGFTLLFFFELNMSLFDGNMRFDVEFLKEHEIAWKDVWNASAENGHMGNSGVASSGSAMPPCFQMAFSILLPMALLLSNG